MNITIFLNFLSRLRLLYVLLAKDRHDAMKPRFSATEKISMRCSGSFVRSSVRSFLNAPAMSINIFMIEYITLRISFRSGFGFSHVGRQAPWGRPCTCSALRWMDPFLYHGTILKHGGLKHGVRVYHNWSGCSHFEKSETVFDFVRGTLSAGSTIQSGSSNGSSTLLGHFLISGIYTFRTLFIQIVGFHGNRLLKPIHNFKS